MGGPDGFTKCEEDVQVWLHMTTLADEKNGGALRLAISGAAKEAARNVTVAQVTSPTGHTRLLEFLRIIFSGIQSRHGHDAYRSLKALYRGCRSMEEYMAEMGQALVQFRFNGYSMSSKTAAALVLDQSGLDANQWASTMAAAALLHLMGNDTLHAITTAPRDLRGGSTPLKPSLDAAMMLEAYGTHQAYVARRLTPVALRPSTGAEVYRGPVKSQDAASS